MRQVLNGRRLDASAARWCSPLVPNRALAPSLKLAAPSWASEGVLVAGPDVTSDSACYRAMDCLLQVRGADCGGRETGAVLRAKPCRAKVFLILCDRAVVA